MYTRKEIQNKQKKNKPNKKRTNKNEEKHRHIGNLLLQLLKPVAGFENKIKVRKYKKISTKYLRFHKDLRVARLVELSLVTFNLIPVLSDLVHIDLQLLI